MAYPAQATLWLRKQDRYILFAYILILCVAIYFYHPWEDEGRAWMISRSNSIPAMFFNALHYEGHPGLWYLLLWPPSHLHLAYHYINWISASCAIAAIYIFLRYSPFPFYLRIVIPFGFALQYQYAVVARSYALFPLLGFICAHLYRKKKQNPVAMGIALALFANVTIYSTAVALGMGFCYWTRRFFASPAPDKTSQSNRGNLVGLLIFAGSVVFVAVCIWPPPYLRARLLDAWSHGQSASVVTLKAEEPRRDDSVPASSTAQSKTVFPGTPSYVYRVALRLYPLLVDPIASYYPLAFAFEALVVVYLLWNKDKALVLPILLLVAALLVGYEQIWHLQMLWVTLIVVLWMAWDTQKDPLNLSLQSALSGLMFLVCLLQMPWTLDAIRYEMAHSTYPADEAAQYIANLLPTKSIGGTGLAFTLRPYFRQEIFTAFSDIHVAYVVSLHPDIIVSDNNLPDIDAQQLSEAGYHPIQSFCGASYFPSRPIRPVCLIIYQTNS